MSATEGSQLYVAVSAIKSMCILFTELRHIGYSLSDAKKMVTMPEEIITSPRFDAPHVPGSVRLIGEVLGLGHTIAKRAASFLRITLSRTTGPTMTCRFLLWRATLFRGPSQWRKVSI